MSLAYNLVTTAASRILAMPLSFLAGVLLARLLGAEQRGVLALAILIPTTALHLGSLGLSVAHTVFAGKYPNKRGAIAFQSLACPLVVGLIMLGFYAFVFRSRPPWFQRFEVVGVSNHLLAWLIVFFHLAFLNLNCSVVGANRITVANIASLLTPVSKLLLVLLLVWWLGMGVTGGILVELGMFVFLSGYMVIAIAVQVPVRTWRPDLSFLKKSISFGIKVHLRYVGMFLAHEVNIFMIAYLMADSDRALGHYVLASQFAMIIAVLPQSMRRVFLPHLSVTIADRAMISARASRVLCLALLPVFAVLMMGSPLIPILVGQDYSGAVAPFMWLLPGLFLWGAIQPLDAYLLYVEKPLYTAINAWLGAVVNIASNLYLIPRMGVCGAAVSLSLSNAFMSAMAIILFTYESKVRLSLFLFKRSDFADLIGLAHRVMNTLTPTRSTQNR